MIDVVSSIGKGRCARNDCWKCCFLCISWATKGFLLLLVGLSPARKSQSRKKQKHSTLVLGVFDNKNRCVIRERTVRGMQRILLKSCQLMRSSVGDSTSSWAELLAVATQLARFQALVVLPQNDSAAASP